MCSHKFSVRAASTKCPVPSPLSLCRPGWMDFLWVWTLSNFCLFVPVGQQNQPQSLMTDYSKAWEDYYKKQSTTSFWKPVYFTHASLCDTTISCLVATFWRFHGFQGRSCSLSADSRRAGELSAAFNCWRARCSLRSWWRPKAELNKAL